MRPRIVPLGLSLLTAPLAASSSTTAQLAHPIAVDLEPTLCALLGDEDTDHDSRITVDDPVGGAGRGDRRFLLRAADGRTLELAGTYVLSTAM